VKINKFAILGAALLVPAMVDWSAFLLSLSGQPSLLDTLNELPVTIRNFSLLYSPIAALLTSLIALKQIKRKKQKGAALSGLIILLSSAHLLITGPSLVLEIINPGKYAV
jgi:hypothetical protein